MASRLARVAVGVIGAVLSLGVAAIEPLGLDARDFHAIDSMAPSAKGRPNEEARLDAMKAYIRGDFNSAVQHFERAAYYADKYAQHSLSLLHWHGTGVPVDRIAAYVWADLAAERGSERLLLVREKMWSQLSAEERARVVEVGQKAYARYSDDVAQPRAEAQMRVFASKMTGSRVGFDNKPMEIAGRPMGGTYAPQMGSMSTMYINSVAATPEQLYGGTRRDVSAYWIEQDRLLDGKVHVGAPVRKR